MTLTVSPWLPAASRADLDILMRRVINRWLADWIVEAVRVDIATPAPAPGSADSWRGAHGAWLYQRPDDVVALGLAACDGRADLINPVDRALLEQVGSEMLEDLVGRLGGNAGINATSRSGPAASGHDGPEREKYRFRVAGSPGDWSLLLAFDDTGLIRLRKAAAGSYRTPDLVPFSVALAGEEVGLGCHLGSAQITAADISALAIGDVLVLDRCLDAPVPLTVDGHRLRTAEARIEAQAGAIQVTVTETIDLMQEI